MSEIALFKKTIILFIVPSKFCISIVLNIFSWGNCKSQEKLKKKMFMQTFGGTTKSITLFFEKGP